MIQVPEWMTVESLERALTEDSSTHELSALPFHYMEIAQLILTNAKIDVKGADQVAVLLQDLENIRMVC